MPACGVHFRDGLEMGLLHPSAAITVLRTVLEDRTLHNELDDYADCARRVEYKLMLGYLVRYLRIPSRI
jgi:hypothetical protein